ncbi:MAG: DMT family transporter [Candidatus Thorarchaeota archaeon]|nr:DMT family transporter [Candidatus Thorarchaeota archaeon]
MHHLRARALLVIASAIWGSTFVVGRVVLPFVSPVLMAFTANSLGAVVLLAALLSQERLSGVSSGFRNRKTLALGTVNGLAYAVQYIALAITTASKTGLLVNLGTAFVPVFAVLLLRDRLESRKVIGLMVGVIGAAAVSMGAGTDTVQSGQLLGDLLALAAGLLWALWIVIAQDTMHELGKPLRVAAPNAIYTALVLLLTLVLFPADWAQLGLIEFQVAAVYLGVFSIGLATAMYYSGLRDMGGVTSATYLMLQSLVAFMLGVCLLAEPFTSVMLVGAFLVILSVWIVR